MFLSLLLFLDTFRAANLQNIYQNTHSNSWKLRQTCTKYMPSVTSSTLLISERSFVIMYKTSMLAWNPAEMKLRNFLIWWCTKWKIKCGIKSAMLKAFPINYSCKRQQIINNLLIICLLLLLFLCFPSPLFITCIQVWKPRCQKFIPAPLALPFQSLIIHKKFDVVILRHRRRVKKMHVTTKYRHYC